MKIIVEETEVEMDLPDKEVKLRDVADEVEQFLYTVGKVPVGLAIDGVELTQEEYDRREDELLDGTKTLQFHVITMLEFLTENIDGAAQANNALIATINEFVEEIRSGRESQIAEGLVSELQQFFDFWLKLNALLPEPMEKVEFGTRSISEILEGVRSLLGEIVTAMEEEDQILATDLLQYEVVPLLESVALGVPALKEELAALEVEEEHKAET